MKWSTIYRHGQGQIGHVTQLLRRDGAKVLAAAHTLTRVQLVRTSDPKDLAVHTVRTIVDTALVAALKENPEDGTFLLEITREEYPQTQEIQFRALLTPVEPMFPMVP